MLAGNSSIIELAPPLHGLAQTCFIAQLSKVDRPWLIPQLYEQDYASSIGAGYSLLISAVCND